MFGFIVDTEDDDTLVFMGELTNKAEERLPKPRYKRVVINSPDLEPPELKARTTRHFKNGKWIEKTLPVEGPVVINPASASALRDLVAALQAGKKVKLEE
jgi:hypothetical protein